MDNENDISGDLDLIALQVTVEAPDDIVGAQAAYIGIYAAELAFLDKGEGSGIDRAWSTEEKIAFLENPENRDLVRRTSETDHERRMFNLMFHLAFD